jgi:fibronectin type 3 domain-containing protein
VKRAMKASIILLCVIALVAVGAMNTTPVKSTNVGNTAPGKATDASNTIPVTPSTADNTISAKPVDVGNTILGEPVIADNMVHTDAATTIHATSIHATNVQPADNGPYYYYPTVDYDWYNNVEFTGSGALTPGGYYGWVADSAGAEIEFFICNQANYNDFVANPSSLPPVYYCLGTGYTVNYNFAPTSTQTWYFVFINNWWSPSYQATLAISQDLTGPTISPSITNLNGHPASQYEAGDTYTLSATASDGHFTPDYMRIQVIAPDGKTIVPINGYQYVYFDGDSISVNWVSERNLTTGEYTVVFYATDGVGNPSTVDQNPYIYAEPTINQPSPVIYTYGQTGNSITWIASSGIPHQYSIRVDSGTTNYYTWSGSSIQVNVDGLSVGTHSVNCTVIDLNSYSASSKVSVTVNSAETAPTAPQNLQATAGNAQVVLTWTAPSSNGGASITNYKIYRGTSSGGESSTPIATVGNVLTYTDTTVTNGQTYYYEVSAVNSVGEGAKSNEASATPSASGSTVPSAPQSLQATGGNAQVVLTWTAPSSNGGASINGYKIYRGTSSGGETLLTTVGNVLTYTDTSASNGQTYYYKVSAVNSVGEGSKSDEASATPTAPSGGGSGGGTSGGTNGGQPASGLPTIAIVGAVAVVVVIGILVVVAKMRKR